MTVIHFEGFPNELSKKIEMPDIAELLMYPAFNRAEVEVFRKYATDFQKKLLDMCPLRNNTRHTLILSSVTILDPSKRVVTKGNSNDSSREWHIDGQGETDDLWDTRETLHLLIGHTTSTTEFNVNPIDIDIPDEWNRADFKRYINSDQIYQTLIPQRMEIGKIHTFTNRHIHRAVPTNGIQFRYTFRARETYKNNNPSLEEIQVPKFISVNDISKNNVPVANIEFGNDHVKVYVPSSFKGFVGDK